MKAVLYCRVSTKEQAQNLSLPTQLQACRAYCERNGLEIAKEFEDAGESAKTTDRPEFQALLEYCRVNKGRVQTVVVYNLSRFSRSAYDHTVVRALLQRLGVSIRSVSEPISDDSVGRLTENMLAAIAQFDNDQRAERTKAGMKTALQRGHWMWVAPLGYINGNRKRGEPSLLRDDVAAPLIQRAFEMASSGEHSIARVLKAATALGLRSKHGAALKPQTFGTLLRNPMYAGRIEAEGFGLRGVRGDFEPLVTESLFQRVQTALRRSEAPSAHIFDNPDYPLRRFVRCDVCEKPLTGSAPKGRSKTYAYYHCRDCSGVRIRTEQLEAQFLNLLESLKPRPEFMPLFRAIVLDSYKRRLDESEGLQKQLEARVEALQQRETRLFEVFVYEKAIDAPTYETQRDKLREEIALARIEAEDARINAIDVEGLLGFAEHVLSNAARLWMEAPPEQKQRLQSVLFPEGLRFRDGRFGTATTCLAFKQLPGNSLQTAGVVTLETPSWNQIERFLGEMGKLRAMSGMVA